jgi:hypothetical protein
MQDLLGGGGWLATIARQLLVAADLVLGQPLPTDPLALLSAALQVAPWLALLPVAVYLWDRDRAAARAG